MLSLIIVVLVFCFLIMYFALNGTNFVIQNTETGKCIKIGLAPVTTVVFAIVLLVMAL